MKLYKDHIIEVILNNLPKNENKWIISGLIDKEKQVHPIGNDSKIIGKIFEIIIKNFLEKTANELGFELREPEKQTIYPDFYFIKPNGRKIAIDIKTTYRKSENSKFSFTVGSFTSYMRNGTKNIVGHYKDYDSHYIIGVLYTREPMQTKKIVNVNHIDEIIPAYNNIEFFVQEKFRICGEKKGSGNTDNIGTISASRLEPFIYGAGPFSYLGLENFNEYWSNYPKFKDSEQKKKSLYTNIPEYIEWVRKKDFKKAENLKIRYEKYLNFYKKKEKRNWR